MRVPSTTDEALAMLHGSLDYLTAADWWDAGGRAQAMALRSLGAAQSKWTVAHAGALAALGASGGYAGDGHPSTRTWLKHQAQATGKAAKDLEDWTERLAAHPLLCDAMAAGAISESWARQLAAWNDRLPAEAADKADKILLDAVRAGLDLHPDIARLAQAIYEAVRGLQPDADPSDDGYEDRDLRLRTTLGGAGRLAGNLSAECAALLAKVIEALGKNVGPGDFRSPGQRAHDALEIALMLALAASDIPQSGGMKTRALAMLSIADIMCLDGASALCDAWLAARAGEPGFFFGPAAESIACAGQVSAVITGTPDWDVLSDMAGVFLDAHGIGEHTHSTQDDASASGDDSDGSGRPCGCTCGGCTCPPPAGLRGPLSPAARLALEQTLLAMSIRALSGPNGLAGFLRANLLGRPFSGKSLVLDVGDTDDIPGHLRRAVIARDRKCQWPGGCDRPAAHCEPHHHMPRHQGGPTSLENIDLYCRTHHHHFIHRLGWKIVKHPDGSRDAISPDGRVIQSRKPPSHAPPGAPAA